MADRMRGELLKLRKRRPLSQKETDDLWKWKVMYDDLTHTLTEHGELKGPEKNPYIKPGAGPPDSDIYRGVKAGRFSWWQYVLVAGAGLVGIWGAYWFVFVFLCTI